MSFGGRLQHARHDARAYRSRQSESPRPAALATRVLAPGDPYRYIDGRDRVPTRDRVLRPLSRCAQPRRCEGRGRMVLQQGLRRGSASRQPTPPSCGAGGAPLQPTASVLPRTPAEGAPLHEARHLASATTRDRKGRAAAATPGRPRGGIRQRRGKCVGNPPEERAGRRGSARGCLRILLQRARGKGGPPRAWMCRWPWSVAIPERSGFEFPHRPSLLRSALARQPPRGRRGPMRAPEG